MHMRRSTMDRLDPVSQTRLMTTTLITGGTGKTGRRVAERLTGLDRSVRIGSRSGSPPFHWDDESAWKPALDGCGTAYLAYAPDLAFPGAAELVGRFAAVAVAAGTSRLVLLSGRGNRERSMPSSWSSTPAPSGPSSGVRSSPGTSARAPGSRADFENLWVRVNALRTLTGVGSFVCLLLSRSTVH